MLLVTTQRLNFSFFKDQSLYLFVVVDIPPPSIWMWLVNVQVENRSFTCSTGAFSINRKSFRDDAWLVSARKLFFFSLNPLFRLRYSSRRR
jgi:hypothetical protein